MPSWTTRGCRAGRPGPTTRWAARWADGRRPGGAQHAAAMVGARTFLRVAGGRSVRCGAMSSPARRIRPISVCSRRRPCCARARCRPSSCSRPARRGSPRATAARRPSTARRAPSTRGRACTPSSPRELARAADARLATEGDAAPLTCGIPFALKDLFAVAGLGADGVEPRAREQRRRRRQRGVAAPARPRRGPRRAQPHPRVRRGRDHRPGRQPVGARPHGRRVERRLGGGAGRAHGPGGGGHGHRRLAADPGRAVGRLLDQADLRAHPRRRLHPPRARRSTIPARWPAASPTPARCSSRWPPSPASIPDPVVAALPLRARATGRARSRGCAWPSPAAPRRPTPRPTSSTGCRRPARRPSGSAPRSSSSRPRRTSSRRTP